MIKKEKTEILILFMNRSLIIIYLYMIKKLTKEIWVKPIILFDFVANNLCDYFQYSSSVNGRSSTTKTNLTNTKAKDELNNIVIDV